MVFGQKIINRGHAVR